VRTCVSPSSYLMLLTPWTVTTRRRLTVPYLGFFQGD